MALYDGDRIHLHRGPGLVHQVFENTRLAELQAVVGIGHTRYSTTGESVAQNAQPLVAVHRHHSYAIAHNGNLSNAPQLRQTLENAGAIFSTTSDTEALLKMFVVADGSPGERMRSIAPSLKGAYSAVMIQDDMLIAFRDPMGFRPLSVGRLGSLVVVASEDSAFHLIKAQHMYDLQPGELAVFQRGQEVFRDIFARPEKASKCVFELIYFSRPDSTVFQVPAYDFRKECGKLLARRETEKIDFVSPVPDSGLSAAIGFSQEAGVPLEMALIRNHYVGRSFIQPGQASRRDVVRNKLLPVQDLIKGASIALVDDSVVRGTTSRLIVELLREFGAARVHLRIASPPLKWPCYFGIDMPTREELLASSRNVDEITGFLGADSVRYLGMDDLQTVLGRGAEGFCYACFTGDYPPGSLPETGAYRRIRK